MSTYSTWYTISSREIGTLKDVVDRAMAAPSLMMGDVNGALRSELGALKEKLLSAEFSLKEVSRSSQSFQFDPWSFF